MIELLGLPIVINPRLRVGPVLGNPLYTKKRKREYHHIHVQAISPIFSWAKQPYFLLQCLEERRGKIKERGDQVRDEADKGNYNIHETSEIDKSSTKYLLFDKANLRYHAVLNTGCSYQLSGGYSSQKLTINAEYTCEVQRPEEDGLEVCYTGPCDVVAASPTFPWSSVPEFEATIVKRVGEGVLGLVENGIQTKLFLTHTPVRSQGMGKWKVYLYFISFIFTYIWIYVHSHLLTPHTLV